MKRALSHTLALISLGFAAFAVTPIHAQTTAPGPYYATPSWDQTLPASTRFIVLSNMNSEAVLDRETGLVWERSPDSEGTWDVVLASCVGKRTGGRFGWRLPTAQELGSLVDPNATSGPPVPSGIFIGIPAGNGPTVRYWTATSTTDVQGFLTFAYQVNWGVVGTRFEVTTGGSSRKTFSALGWCVRGGQVVDPQ